MRSLIFHVDVNSAFLSWESAKRLRDNPDALDLRTINAVIGGDEKMRHGVVLAKSPSAKKYGIMTGEPLSHARQKCPELVVVPPDHELYAASSRKFIEILEEVAPVIEQCSIDEAFCDMTGTEKLYGDPVVFATKLKDRIYKELGFTVNIGISTNKLLAKMASDFEKPNKVHTLYNDEISKKMWPLPIGDLYGVGKSSQEKMIKLGINTIYDLAHSSKEQLYPYFKNQSKYLIDIANGIDNSEVISDISDPKCISTTNTLLYDYDDITEINKELKLISIKLGSELKKKNKYANTIAIIVKDKYFKTTSKQKKLDNATNSSDTIYEIAKKLFKEHWDLTPVRLIGIRLDALSDTNDYQISLFEDIDAKINDEKINKTIEELRNKFGNKIIK